MQLSFASVVSLLVAAQTASAWQIIGYGDTRTCGTNSPNRVLRGSTTQTTCFTFGQSMPGVTCTHYARNGAPAEGCHGHLPIVSIRHGTGENCAFYRGAGCTGDTIIKSGVNGCATFGDRTTIGSYRCSTR